MKTFWYFSSEKESFRLGFFLVKEKCRPINVFDTHTLDSIMCPVRDSAYLVSYKRITLGILDYLTIRRGHPESKAVLLPIHLNLLGSVQKVRKYGVWGF